MEIVYNSMGHFSSVPSLPWWGNLGPRPTSCESFGQLKSSSNENSSNLNALAGSEHERGSMEEGRDRANTTQFTTLPGDCKSSEDAQKLQKLQAVIPMQPALPEYLACVDQELTQPMGGRILLPLNLTADDGPIYVNPKQYHGIIRRRKSRAKAELEKNRIEVRKPYMHESRHLHAMRRLRGSGGRFLKTKNMKGEKGSTDSKGAGPGQFSQTSKSQSSEVLQSGSGPNARAANGTRSDVSGSEETNMYSHGCLHNFSMNYLPSSVHSLSDLMAIGHGAMPGKWAAADQMRSLRTCSNR